MVAVRIADRVRRQSCARFARLSRTARDRILVSMEERGPTVLQPQPQPQLQLRRGAAFLVDAMPGWILVWLAVGPAVFLLGMLAEESFFGIGIWDPKVGGDPVMFSYARIASERAGQWLPALGAWIAARAAMAGVAGVSLGKLAVGLRVVDSRGARLSRGRLLFREILRDAPGAIVVAAFAAPAPAPALLFWKAPMAVFGAVVVVLAFALVAAAATAARVARDAGARSWLDVAAGTVVRRWSNDPGRPGGRDR
jgi:hypothetical protein